MGLWVGSGGIKDPTPHTHPRDSEMGTLNFWPRNASQSLKETLGYSSTLTGDPLLKSKSTVPYLKHIFLHP